MSFFSSRRQPDAPPSTTEERSQSNIPALPPQPVGFETVLGANCVLEGKLSSKTNVRLDGTFTGTLEIDGNVLVGETAKITADIHARNVSIAGAVHGNVSGKKVQLLRTGRIWGDIQATALTTEEGAFIDGKITMMSHDAAAPETPAAEEAPQELVDEIAPITEEAQQRGIDEVDVLSESDMAAEGGIPDEIAKDRTEGN
jgi:cytoskeletal protein CcmA (bactofilin family)